MLASVFPPPEWAVSRNRPRPTVGEAHLLIDIGDEAGARRQLDGAIELAEANASGWSIRNRALHGFLLAHEGQADRGIELMRSAAEEWASRGFRLFVPYDRALLAQACLFAGRLEEGFRAIEEGTAVARETGQSFWDAELLRLRGELLAASGAPPQEVRGVFQQAIDVATRQGAVALVRRVDQSLQGSPPPKHPSLQPVALRAASRPASLDSRSEHPTGGGRAGDPP
jgi:hypothetical protein